jgi:hypothetical protein
MAASRYFISFIYLISKFHVHVHLHLRCKNSLLALDVSTWSSDRGREHTLRRKKDFPQQVLWIKIIPKQLWLAKRG